MTFEMPERQETDGGVQVGVAGEGMLLIEAITKGQTQGMVVSRYNAARLLCMLCLMLEVPHPKALGKLPM